MSPQVHHFFSADRTSSFTIVNCFFCRLPHFFAGLFAIFLVVFFYICNSITFFLFFLFIGFFLFFISFLFLFICIGFYSYSWTSLRTVSWFLLRTLSIPFFFWSVSLLLPEGFRLLLALYHSIFNTFSCSITSCSSTCSRIAWLRSLPKSSWCILLKADT